MSARPAWRWVGGKADLVPHILPRLPSSFRAYHEPFCGGAALFYALQPRDAYLNDASPHVALAYRIIRDSVDSLIAELSNGELYVHDLDAYYRLRERFNAGGGSEIERAAAFLYLLRCGFNGLWRVNRDGGYNVPFGDQKNPRICDAELLRACSRALRGVHVGACDFAYAVADAEPGDLVYFDSPYWPVSKTSSFTAYTPNGFPEADHVRLAKLFSELVGKGVQCVASNSDTPEVRELYAGFELHEVQRSGTVSSKVSKRGKVGELLICGGVQR